VIRIRHTTGIVSATIHLPSSKSLANRALVIRYLSGVHFPIHNLPMANDTQILQRMLDSQNNFDAEDAGTVFRFLTAALAVTPGRHVLNGSSRLAARPIQMLIDTLEKLGASIHPAGNNGLFPMVIEGKILAGGYAEIDASVSSQFVSALLMIAPKMEQGLELKLNGSIASLPYIEMTLMVMKHFGIQYHWQGDRIVVPKQSYAPAEFTVEADWSAAAFWLEAAALSRQSEIILPSLNADSIQGDKIIAGKMKAFGVDCVEDGNSIILKKTSAPLPAFYETDCFATPDLMPALIATAAGLNVSAKITGLQNLNAKESRRKDVLEGELSRNGIKMQSDTSRLETNGGRLTAAPIFDVHNDHRMAMCFASLALCTQSVTLNDETVVKKSYPDFWKHFEMAGFRMEHIL
jgi:3-phosphoshikimate 1-carboxyvinyltransferase